MGRATIQTAVERHSYDNLVLLCANHHTIIDDDPEAYTVQRLAKMKTDHTSRVTPLGVDEVKQGTRLLIDQSVVATNQSGGITAHTVHQTINVHAPMAQHPQGTERQSIIARAREFHRGRVTKIVTTAAPVTLLDGAKLVLHVVPFSAVDERVAASFDNISRNPHSFPPIAADHARDSRIDYTGLLTGSNAEGLAKPQRAYVSVSRFAAVESVASSLARGRDHDFLILPQIQAMIIKYAHIYARSLNTFGEAAPMTVLMSLVNVKGMRLLQDFMQSAFLEDMPFRLLPDDWIEFDEVTFDAIPRDYTDCARMLLPMLRHLANAAGLQSPPNFDADGNYMLKL